MRENLKRYFVSLCLEISQYESVSIDILAIIKVLDNPGNKHEQYFFNYERQQEYKLTLENFGSFTYLAFTTLSDVLYYTTHLKEQTPQYWPHRNSGCLYYMKAIPEKNFIFFERSAKAIAFSSKSNTNFNTRLLLHKISIKNDYAKLTIQHKAYSKKCTTRYWSFKNLKLIRSVITSKNILSAVFPKSNLPFVQSLISFGQNWNVSFKEMEGINTMKEFLQCHVNNSGGVLKVTNKISKYPLKLVYEFCKIKDEYIVAVIGQFLTTLTVSQLAFDDNPIYTYLYFKLKDQQVMPHKDFVIYLNDYFRLCNQSNIYPNVRISSVKRLKLEHDILMREEKRSLVPEFTAPIPILTSAEQDGYSISYIKNDADLIAESVEMKHCVTSYASDIQKGNSVIYKVEGNNERATLELARSGNAKAYSVRQLKGKFNETVSDMMIKAVEKILKNNIPDGKLLNIKELQNQYDVDALHF